MEAVVLKRVCDALMNDTAKVIIADERLWAALDECWDALRPSGVNVEPPVMLCEHLRVYFRAPDIRLDVIIECLVPLVHGALRDVVEAGRGTNNAISCWIGTSHAGLIEAIYAVTQAKGLSINRHVAVTGQVGRELDRIVPLILAEQHWLILAPNPITDTLAQMLDEYGVEWGARNYRAKLGELALDLFVIDRRHLSLRALQAGLRRYYSSDAPSQAELAATPLISLATIETAALVEHIKEALRVKIEERLMGAPAQRISRAQARTNN